jgi:hypothetical protein
VVWGIWSRQPSEMGCCFKCRSGGSILLAGARIMKPRADSCQFKLWAEQGANVAILHIITQNQYVIGISGGWGGIRTLETLARLPVFKTGAFNHSATHPLKAFQLASSGQCSNETKTADSREK